MKDQHRKHICPTQPSTKKNLALRVPQVNFTLGEVDLLLSVIDLLAQVENDPRAGATIPLIREIGRRALEMQHKLLLIKGQQEKKVLLENADYLLLYTATMVFGQIKLLAPVLLPDHLAEPHVEAQVLALEKKIVSALPSVRIGQERKE